MKRNVYRSLDKTSEFFGIKTKFLIVFLACSCFAVILGITVGVMTGLYVGIGVLIVAEFISFFFTIYLQSRISEKKLFRVMAQRSLPTVYIVRPKHIRNRWKGFSLNSETR